MPEAKKHAFKRLAELGDAVVEEVDRRLLSGEAPSSVARYLQEDCGLLKDLKPGSVKKNLERYRAHDLKDRVVEELADKARGKGLTTIKRKLVAMDELEDLVAIQKGRLGKLLVKERSLPEGIVLKQASDEVRLLKETLVELGKLQLETGVMIRAPKKVTGSVMDPATGDVTHFAWTEEQEALFRQLEGVKYVEVEDAEDAVA